MFTLTSHENEYPRWLSAKFLFIDRLFAQDYATTHSGGGGGGGLLWEGEGGGVVVGEETAVVLLFSVSVQNGIRRQDLY